MVTMTYALLSVLTLWAMASRKAIADFGSGDEATGKKRTWELAGGDDAELHQRDKVHLLLPVGNELFVDGNQEGAGGRRGHEFLEPHGELVP